MYVGAIAVVLAGYLMLKRTGQISKQEAAEYLKNGALVIDVRSEAEFESGHLTRAINLPLDKINILTSSMVKSKNQVLLLHCQSGMRSGAAIKRLVEMGYTKSYNLGSYDRASQILSGK
jgi:phage shock protein E